MIRIGHAPGAFDLFHIGHLNLLRRAKEHCDFLIAGIVADEVLIRHKKVTPAIPLAERLKIVRNVRFVNMAHAAVTNDKTEIWKGLRFKVLFEGNDWQGTEKGQSARTRVRGARRRCGLFSVYAGDFEQHAAPDGAEYRCHGQLRPHRPSLRWNWHMRPQR